MTTSTTAVAAGLSAPSFTGTVSGLMARLGSAFARFLAARRERAQMRELMALDDHMLKDIGLHRSEVTRAVKGRFS
jgi:uncharacterized protein YjiS (DUF1127 family)